MKRNSGQSRRSFIIRCGSLATVGILALGACDGKQDHNSTDNPGGDPSVTSCDDLSSVGESDLALRKKLGYVEKSPITDNQCQNCNLFLPPKQEQKCGGCMLFKGPVFTDAYCTYWAPKV